ncbi:MAG TPA: hypothetical protein VE992_02025 [Solirubrobacteraceae bacterium]|nr:hypothetical protein [Solirubrobacteraceae bacterium]
MRTTDGGAHFVGIPAPRAQLASPTGPGLAQLRFADPLDGFAGDDGPAGPLWETHDGGAHWQVGLDDVMVFTVSAGHVYALTGRCGSGACSGLELAVSPASGDHWTTAALPSAAASGFPAITAHGSSVWISLTPATASARSQTLLYSDYAGVHPLVAMASPCVPGLGGDLQASSDQVVWAVCPTGMMAGAWRSTDAGRHWSPLSGRTASGRRLAMSNGARLAPSSDTGAVLATGDTGELLRTTDAGASFATVVAPSPSGAQWMWIGFTDPQTGTALRADQGPAVGPTHVSPASLWRSSDGGASWHGPIAIG